MRVAQRYDLCGHLREAGRRRLYTKGGVTCPKPSKSAPRGRQLAARASGRAATTLDHGNAWRDRHRTDRVGGGLAAAGLAGSGGPRKRDRRRDAGDHKEEDRGQREESPTCGGQSESTGSHQQAEAPYEESTLLVHKHHNRPRGWQQLLPAGHQAAPEVRLGDGRLPLRTTHEVSRGPTDTCAQGAQTTSRSHVFPPGL